LLDACETNKRFYIYHKRYYLQIDQLVHFDVNSGSRWVHRFHRIQPVSVVIVVDVVVPLAVVEVDDGASGVVIGKGKVIDDASVGCSKMGRLGWCENNFAASDNSPLGYFAWELA